MTPIRIRSMRELHAGENVALLRYSSAMATIQIRELPEETYEVLRRRARRAGQSMQAYLRDEIVDLAGRPTKTEALEVIEATLARVTMADSSPTSILDDLSADRR